MYASIILQADGLTLEQVLADLPHDAAAIFVYVLLAACVILIWWVNRPGSRPPGPVDPVDHQDASPDAAAGGESERPATQDRE